MKKKTLIFTVAFLFLPSSPVMGKSNLLDFLLPSTLNKLEQRIENPVPCKETVHYQIGSSQKQKGLREVVGDLGEKFYVFKTESYGNGKREIPPIRVETNYAGNQIINCLGPEMPEFAQPTFSYLSHFPTCMEVLDFDGKVKEIILDNLKKEGKITLGTYNSYLFGK